MWWPNLWSKLCARATPKPHERVRGNKRMCVSKVMNIQIRYLNNTNKIVYIITLKIKILYLQIWKNVNRRFENALAICFMNFMHDNLGKVKLLSLHWNWFLSRAHTHNGFIYCPAVCIVGSDVEVWNFNDNRIKQEDPALLPPPTPHHGQIFFFGGGGGGGVASTCNKNKFLPLCGHATLLQSLPPRW